MEPTIANRADAPAALAMAVFFLSFGIFGIVRPEPSALDCRVLLSNTAH